MSDNHLDSIFSDDWGEDHRSGAVAVVGQPNVGKSTLVNQILGQKIAIVTPKPQTTRRRQLGIYTEPRGQILFVDTPGMHQPQHKLGEFMVRTAEEALRDVDAILALFDVSRPPDAADRALAERVARRRDTPVVLVLNKADLLRPADRETRIADYEALLAHETTHLVSALSGEGVPALVDDLMARMPPGPRLYPADQLTELNMRQVAAEIIREKVMLLTSEEIPHAVAVEVDSYQERSEDQHYVSAIIYVERESQKGIVVGKGGQLIKQIGAAARQDLEALTGARMFLDLRVKVRANWRTDEAFIQRLGYRLPKDRD